MNFAENYAQLTDDELLKVAGSRGRLVHDAALALDAEMARRGFDYHHARVKMRQSIRLEIEEDRKCRTSPRWTKYFVRQIHGRWLLLALSPCLLVFLLSFPHLVSEEWLLAMMDASFGAVIAISSAQPWLRRIPNFWFSLPVSCIVQLLVGHIICVRSAPRSSSEMKGAAFLAILAGYAVGVPLFLLLQRVWPKHYPEEGN